MQILEVYKNLDLGLLSLQETAQLYKLQNPHIQAMAKVAQKRIKKWRIRK